MRPATPAFAAALALVLGACAGARVADPTAAATPPAPAATCQAEAATGVVGALATPALLEQARLGAGAARVRTLAPGQAVTLEYDGRRLNLVVDAEGRVTSLHCG